MQLNLVERFKILGILPAQGSMVTIKIVHDLKQLMSTSEDEISEWEIKQGENQITWNSQANTDKDFDIGDTAKEIIVDALKELDKKEAMTEEHVTLWDKFIDSDD